MFPNFLTGVAMSSVKLYQYSQLVLAGPGSSWLVLAGPGWSLGFDQTLPLGPCSVIPLLPFIEFSQVYT